MADRDPASEDFQWPEVKDLRPVDALRLLDDIEREARLANKRADALKARKAQAKQIALAVLEDYEQESTKIVTAEGRKVIYEKYDIDFFTVDDHEAFKPWSDTQSESYYDASPKLREGIFQDEMRRRAQDGEPLPPGVKQWTDTRLSRTAAKGKG